VVRGESEALKVVLGLVGEVASIAPPLIRTH